MRALTRPYAINKLFVRSFGRDDDDDGDGGAAAAVADALICGATPCFHGACETRATIGGGINKQTRSCKAAIHRRITRISEGQHPALLSGPLCLKITIQITFLDL